MIYFARHGETQWNKKGLVCGRADIPLTEKGYQQAEELGEKVKELAQPVTKIIHSPLIRAKETARAVSRQIQIPLEEDARLAEFDFGTYDGVLIQNETLQAVRTHFAYRFPDGESVLDAAARIYPLIQECLADEENTYLLVCHNALIRVMHTYFESIDNEDFFNFSVTNTALLSYESKKLVD
ncbi:phosphoglycerate mutase [Enterococcus sp. JM4C]|uniref:histidine phosphatase family protein n=1 Tax=Candidatus Enterococcus huntleyi TaxID=1857217 RepID=UPI001379BD48|nr:histidine phosphatase family protein [Enterococcus sp. JM4C]KAF1295643.1 phosphoglycerate mutase [Enterococcus sp. JM4C]